MKIHKFLPLFLSCSLFSATPCFRPPDCWVYADPKKHSSSIDAAFIAPIKRGFAPSINITSERTDLSPEEYLDAVEAQFTKNRLRTYRRLGRLETLAGTAYLAQIENTSPPQATTSLQSIVIVDGRAHIMTGIAKRRDFPRCRKSFLRAFSSFCLLENLVDAIPESKRRDALKRQGKDLTSYLENNHQEEGLYWQLLYIQSLQTSP